ncbi:ABC transporter substrate-binding protein [Amycolatopsis azurea]|uniref:ABC transporter substrate-binding protein n=1 Tax=Amycolatopsis azurea TaxID=36819 RepID=UPI0037FDE1C6
MHSPPRRIALGLRILLAVAAALLATTCGPTLSLEHPLAVRVLVPPELDTLPLRLGVERGYFSAEGLTVTVLQEPDQCAGLHTLASGGAEIAFGASTVVVEAVYSGLRVTILAEAAWLAGRTAAIVVRDDGSVPDLAALTRRPVGAPHAGTQDRLLAQASLDNTSGAAPSNQVEWATMDMSEHIVTHLADHDIDAAVIREPWLTDAIHTHGFTTLTYLAATNLLYPLSTYVATTTWADRHPDTVAAFQRALHQAARDSTRPAIDNLAVRQLPINPDTAARMDIPLFPPRGPSVSQLQRVSNLLQHYGIIAGPYRIAPLVAPAGE